MNLEIVCPERHIDMPLYLEVLVKKKTIMLYVALCFIWFNTDNIYKLFYLNEIVLFSKGCFKLIKSDSKDIQKVTKFAISK